MKRSEINQIMAQADDFIRSFGYVLPPFAYWTPDEMRAHDCGSATSGGIR